MIDLQETARIKEAIESKPADFEKIIEDTKLAICITDEDQNFAAVNNNYLKLYEFNREDLIGQSFLKVVPQETQGELSELHDKFIEIQIEMMRDWVVLSKTGKKMKISVDAGFSDQINDAPHKITFVQLEEYL